MDRCRRARVRDNEEEQETKDPSSALWLPKNEKSPWFVEREEEEGRGEIELREEQHKYAEKRLLKKRKNNTSSPVQVQYSEERSKLPWRERRREHEDICFANDGAQFLSASFDRNIKLWDTETGKAISTWEFGIPVVVKRIREPHMHAMPSVAVHPEGKWMAAQSLDNQIVVYSASDKVRLNAKKRFAGHTTGGHSCQVNFSRDGRFLMSGDGDGRCWFWEWQSRRIHSTLRCHHGVCNGCEWHPLLPSHVATCGAHGLIKYWT